MAIITNTFMKMITGHVDKFRMTDSNLTRALSKQCSSSCDNITRLQYAGAVADEEFVRFILFVRPVRISSVSGQ